MNVMLSRDSIILTGLDSGWGGGTLRDGGGGVTDDEIEIEGALFSV